MPITATRRQRDACQGVTWPRGRLLDVLARAAWTRYEADAPYPTLVKTVAHVAFEVEDLAEAISGKHVIIEPNSPSPGVLVAFIEDNGAPIELLQIDRRIAEEGI
jgi:hypothetical protein